MNRYLAVIAAAILAVVTLAPLGQTEEARKPNIVLIYADDLGYGDVGCYGAKKVTTPNIDKLAAGGLRFTDGHCSSATCTPSRYALMTGEYPWRKKGTGILPGNASLIIPADTTTLPSVLKKAGYTNAVVGKWHHGLGGADLDWNGPIKPGPLEIGFDHCFLVPATGDRVPCVYVEDHKVAGLDPADPIKVSYAAKIGDEPTGKDNPDLLKMKLTKGHDMIIVNGISRIGFMTGGKAARWVDEDMADVLTKKATSFIEKNKDRPFFLYFATHDIHVPRVPHKRFVGKSECGTRGDVIVELDWCVGEVIATLDRLNLTENTLVILSSDNGPVLDDGYADGAVKDLNGHTPAGPLRGGKYSPFEGGTRVPFIVRWPAKVKAGVSDALVCQIDLMASLASLVGQKLPAEAGPDSLDVLPALLGEAKAGREHLVEHANVLSLRKGPWKLIEPGRTMPNAKPQLYNLADDLVEEKNVAAAKPDVVREMSDLLEKIRKDGRSRP